MAHGKDGALGIDDDLLTTPEAAKLLRITPQTLYRHRWEGRGPAFVRIGGKIMYRRSDLSEYAKSQEPGGGHAKSSRRS